MTSLPTPPAKRAKPADIAALVRGSASADGIEHHVTEYSWWHSHDGSVTAVDKSFPTRRMALLYCSKKNSDELKPHVGSDWAKHFQGVYELHPNTPFQLDAFLDLSDELIEAYASELSNAFCRLVRAHSAGPDFSQKFTTRWPCSVRVCRTQKIAKGTVWRYVQRKAQSVNVDELITMLSREGKEVGEPSHVERQRLLMGNLAGFD
jgi:hypothetical protein